MLCAISGEAPEVPVASKKSGTVFEKRLIEDYIREKGSDPVTGEDLSLDDLVELRQARIVKPRPPTLTSIPSLLSVFQNEWDAIALETFTLKQQLSQTRQELSTALYQNDAAVRVIARLTKERDEARDALSKISMTDRRSIAAATGNEDAMQVDNTGLPPAILAKIEATQEKLSKTRRKRAIPEDWITPDEVRSINSAAAPVSVVPPQSKALALHKDGDLTLVGGPDGSAGIFSISNQQLKTLPAGSGTITNGLWWGSRAVVTDSTGGLQIFDNNKEVATLRLHAGAATGVSLHPTGDILATVGVDKSFIFYDLTNNQVLSQTYADAGLLCCQFHPDGHLFAAGGVDGQIKIFDVKNLSNVANFTTVGSVQALSFSENGIWLAAATKDSSTVSVWDLRKMAEVKSLEFGSAIHDVEWDYTGQYLLGGGPNGVVVQAYNKAAKSWSELLSKAISASAVRWGPHGKSVVVLTTDGGLEFLR